METDVDLLLNHWTEPLVRRYLFDDLITDRETVAGFIAQSTASFQKDGYGLWVVTGKLDGGFRGVCGFCETIARLDLLFSIAPPYWSQGLATESAGCVLRYAFDKLGLQQVMATVDKPNTISVRVLEKLGMSLLEEQSVNGKSILLYSLAQRRP